MKVNNPTFAFIARTNTGKSTMAATLTLNENIEISNKPNTTIGAQGYTPKNTSLTFWDTPGFDRPQEMIRELRDDSNWEKPFGKERIEEFYYKYKEYNKNKLQSKKSFAFEEELLKPIVEHNAAILYIMVGTETYSEKSYIFRELEILACTERPIYIFVNKKPRFLDREVNEQEAQNVQDWIDKLNVKYRVLPFDPIESDYEGNMQMFDALTHFVPSWSSEIQQAKKSVQKLYADMICDNSKVLLTAMKKILDYKQSEVLMPGDYIDIKLKCLSKEYQQDIIKLIQESQNEIKTSWEHKHIELDTVESHKLFPENFTTILESMDSKTVQGASSGAAVGLMIDIITGGITLGLGTALGGVTGAFAGTAKELWCKIGIDSSGKVKFKEKITVGADRLQKGIDIKILSILVQFSMIIGNRSHANHTVIKIDDIEKFQKSLDFEVQARLEHLHQEYKNNASATDIDKQYRNLILNILLKNITNNDPLVVSLCLDVLPKQVNT